MVRREHTGPAGTATPVGQPAAAPHPQPDVLSCPLLPPPPPASPGCVYPSAAATSRTLPLRRTTKRPGHTSASEPSLWPALQCPASGPSGRAQTLQHTRGRASVKYLCDVTAFMLSALGARSTLHGELPMLPAVPGAPAAVLLALPRLTMLCCVLLCCVLFPGLRCCSTLRGRTTSGTPTRRPAWVRPTTGPSCGPPRRQAGPWTRMRSRAWRLLSAAQLFGEFSYGNQEYAVNLGVSSPLQWRFHSYSSVARQVGGCQLPAGEGALRRWPATPLPRFTAPVAGRHVTFGSTRAGEARQGTTAPPSGAVGDRHGAAPESPVRSLPSARGRAMARRARATWAASRPVWPA